MLQVLHTSRTPPSANKGEREAAIRASAEARQRSANGMASEGADVAVLAEMQAELQRLKGELAAVHAGKFVDDVDEAVVSDVMRDRALAKAEAELASAKDGEEQLKAEHAAALEQLKAEHGTAMEKLLSAQSELAKDSEEQIRAEHETAVAKLQAEHSAALAQASAAPAEAMKDTPPKVFPNRGRFWDTIDHHHSAARLHHCTNVCTYSCACTGRCGQFTGRGQG